jgi:hypothetical protein
MDATSQAVDDSTCTTALCQSTCDDDHHEGLMRMFTRWRVRHLMLDTNVQLIKDDLPQLFEWLHARMQMQLDQTGPHGSLEAVQSAAQSLLRNLKGSKAERRRAQQYYNPVGAKTRVLGSCWIEKPTSYGSKQVEVQDICVDCLVEEQIEMLLCSPELAQEALRDKRCTADDVIADVHDGSVFREHPLFSWCPTAFCFGFYGDDFQVHIPIGPKAGEHKVSLHYAVLYNLPKDLRFNINNLLLVTVVFTADVKKYGAKRIVSGEGDDSSLGGSMRRFANGIIMPKFNQLAGLQIDHMVYGALLLFYADSPFLHLYLSRKESSGPSTYKVCHHCTCKNTNKHLCFSVHDEDSPWEPITTRVLEEQRQLLKDVEGNAKEWQKVSKETGLNHYESTFHGIPWFDETKQAYNDYFHGEPEGPVKDHVYLVTQHGIAAGYFTLQQFINAVSQFPYYKEAGAFNPSKIFKPAFFTNGKPHKKLGKCLKMTGHQSLVLGLTLPAILWTLCPHDDPHWACFLDHMTCVSWGLQDTFYRSVCVSLSLPPSLSLALSLSLPPSRAAAQDAQL